MARLARAVAATIRSSNTLTPTLAGAVGVGARQSVVVSSMAGITLPHKALSVNQPAHTMALVDAAAAANDMPAVAM